MGKDSEGHLYWFFYGTRLYREAPSRKPQRKKKPDDASSRGKGRGVAQTPGEEGERKRGEGVCQTVSLSLCQARGRSQLVAERGSQRPVCRGRDLGGGEEEGERLGSHSQRGGGRGGGELTDVMVRTSL